MIKHARAWDDIRERLAARTQATKPALTFTGIPLEYWRAEVALGCTASLARLRAIVRERGADWETTMEGLKICTK